MVKPKDWLVFEQIFKTKFDYRLTNEVKCKFNKKHKAQLIYHNYECFYYCSYCKKKLKLIAFIMQAWKYNKEQAKRAIATTLNKIIPTVSLGKASRLIGKILRSKVQVLAIDNMPKSIPCQLDLYLNATGKNGFPIKEKVFTWKMKKHENDVLYEFIDSKTTIDSAQAKLVKLELNKEKFRNKHNLTKKTTIEYEIQISKSYTIYESIVIDYQQYYIEDKNKSNTQNNLTIFTFEKKLETGIVYDIDYVVAPNDRKNNRISGIAWCVSDNSSNIDKFRLTEKNKKSLAKFIGTDHNEQFEIFKEFCGKRYMAKYLWLGCALSFHSVISFDYLGNKNCRGVTRVSIIGDTRTGKSQVNEMLIQQHLIGKKYNATQTTAKGFTGGSKNHKEQGNKIAPGILPNNHRGLIVLEEVHSASHEYYKSVREVKSSGKVIIGRVGEEATFDAILRIIEISNPLIRENTDIKGVTHFKTGESIILNNIKLPEDIARQDLFVITKEKSKANYFNDIVQPTKLSNIFTPQDFNNKIMWIWSRKREQIIIDDEVAKYVFEKSEYMYNNWKTKSGLFNSETDQKLMRWAVAYAAMALSTDETYENIIVKKEHVDVVYEELFIKNYFNEIFKLKDAIEEYKARNLIDDLDWERFDEIRYAIGNLVEFSLRNQEMTFTNSDFYRLEIFESDNNQQSIYAKKMIDYYFMERLSHNKLGFNYKFIIMCNTFKEREKNEE